MTGRRSRASERPGGGSTGGADAAPDPDWLRRRTLGKVAAVAFNLGGVALMGFGAISQAGPFGWLTALEVRAFGASNFVLTVAPVLIVMTAVNVWVSRASRRLDRPILAGWQEALDPRAAPLVQPTGAARRSVLRRAMWAALGVAGASAFSGLVGYEVFAHAGPPGGAPLPVVTLADLLKAGTPLPTRARLTDVTAQPRAAWTHAYAIRQTRYRQYYFPLTGVRWRAGERVDVLEEDHTLPDDAPGPDNVFNSPGPREGELTRDPPPAWMIDEMRRAGLAVVDRPVRLIRRKLDGRTPGPDGITALVWLFVCGPVCLIALLFAASARAQARRWEPDPA